MRPIRFIERTNGKLEEEKVYGKWALYLLYGKHPFSLLFSLLLVPFIAKAFFSRFYGWLQKTKRSKKKIERFIRSFGVNAEEFQKKVEEFESFNDFFTRKLRSESRPWKQDEKTAILFADGRYLVYPDLSQVDGFVVKGKTFSLEALLKDSHLAKKYERGSMVIARLCPTDYHRFHFPCEGVPGKAQLINGSLFSVNPWALKHNIGILTENKRVITPFSTKKFGEILYLEIGATNVGSILQTYSPDHPVQKGDEKGYFSFGGSCIILLFEEGKIVFDEDLVRNSAQKVETRGLLGQSLGKIP